MGVNLSYQASDPDPDPDADADPDTDLPDFLKAEIWLQQGNGKYRILKQSERMKFSSSALLTPHNYFEWKL
jgi:hypothetical protein